MKTLVRVLVCRVVSESEASREVKDAVIVLWENRELLVSEVSLDSED